MSDGASLVPELPPQKKIRAGDYDIAYFVSGPEGGRPLLLCHGLAASGLQFVADAKFFGDLGFKVIVPDLRGHGNSTGPKRRADEDFSITRMAADLIAVLDAEEVTETDWVGNSLGGILGLSLMDTDSQRLKSFICFGTAFALKVPETWVSAIRLVYDAIGGDLMAQAGAPMTTWQPEAQAVILEMLRTMDIDAVVRVARAVHDYDMIANALTYGGQMLMLKGENDRPVNFALRSTLSAMNDKANFRLLDVKGAGHVANLDQPEKVRTAILDFLGR